MRCHLCNNDADGTIRCTNTRTDSNNVVIRRRHCLACNVRWYTAEIPVPTEAIQHGEHLTKKMTTFELKGSVFYLPTSHDTPD